MIREPVWTGYRYGLSEAKAVGRNSEAYRAGCRALPCGAIRLSPIAPCRVRKTHTKTPGHWQKSGIPARAFVCFFAFSPFLLFMRFGKNG
jgi:hypothetical protein